MRDEIRRIFFVALIFLCLVGCTRKPEQISQQQVLDSTEKAEDYLLRGREQYSFDNLEGALALEDSSIAFRPNNATAWACKASTLARMRRHEEAQAAYEQALILKPKYPSALWHRAADCAVSGNKERALFFLKQTIDLDTNYKHYSLEDDCFKDLWNDQDFKKLVE